MKRTFQSGRFALITSYRCSSAFCEWVMTGGRCKSICMRANRPSVLVPPYPACPRPRIFVSIFLVKYRRTYGNNWASVTLIVCPIKLPQFRRRVTLFVRYSRLHSWLICCLIFVPTDVENNNRVNFVVFFLMSSVVQSVILKLRD